MTQQLPEHTSAHRPTVTSRWRMLPLALLALAVLAATVVGALHGGTVTSDLEPAAAEVPATGAPAADPASRAAAAKDPCRPAWDPRLKGEPWKGSRRAASERTYATRIAEENPAYVRGRKGWLFFTDYQASNFSQAVGRLTHTAKQRSAWADFIRRSQRTAAKLDTQYYVSVSPGNWAVYPEKLPRWAQKLRGSTSLDKLMKAHPELPWIDTRPALRGADQLTYEPLNSHWTPYGGWVAWDAIATCLRSNGLKGVKVPALRKVRIEDNLNEFAVNGVADGAPQRTVPVYKKKHPQTVITHVPDGEVLANVPDDSVDMLLLPVRTRTPKADTNKTLLVLRDSTGSALSPLWSNSFRTTFQYNHGVGTDLADPPNLRRLIKKHKPDVVLFVMTERFLSFPPPS